MRLPSHIIGRKVETPLRRVNIAPKRVTERKHRTQKGKRDKAFVFSIENTFSTLRATISLYKRVFAFLTTF